MPSSDVTTYSFALIHAKGKTRFSRGKPRNIVWKSLHDTEQLTELLYSFRSVMLKVQTIKHAVLWTSCNSNSVAITQWNESTHGTLMYRSNRSFNIPPGQPPGHLTFLKIIVQIPPYPGQNAVQMPHTRVHSGDQMPPPRGHFTGT